MLSLPLGGMTLATFLPFGVLSLWTGRNERTDLALKMFYCV